MKWIAYCMTCQLNLAVMRTYSSTSLHGSVVEKFAEHHIAEHPGHKVIVGYPMEQSKPEPVITFKNKGVAHHG